MGFAKIFPLGHRIIKSIFDDVVEITEKVDGSQFSFGVIDGELVCKSKRTTLTLDKSESQFHPAVDHVKKIADKLHPNWMYFGETLKSPRHNVIKYDRVPLNHIALFGIYDVTERLWLSCDHQTPEALRLEIDMVPVLFNGIANLEICQQLINKVSFLGGSNIEGIVIKNYEKSVMIGDVVFSVMCGKWVHDAFKEKHSDLASRGGKKKDSWEGFCEGFLHENRWRKAIRHLADDGKVLGEPQDIGPLIKEIHNDIVEEEKDEILEFLWKQHSPHLLRKSIQGFPEWYKEQIASGGLENILSREKNEEDFIDDDFDFVVPPTLLP